MSDNMKIKHAYIDSVKGKKTEDRTFEQIIGVCKSDRVLRACQQILSARQEGNEELATKIKSSLPCWVPNRSYGTGNPIKKNTGTPTGVVPIDFDADDLPFAEQKAWAEQLSVTLKELVLTNDFAKRYLLAAHFSPKMKGVHALVGWIDGCRTVQEVQDRFVAETGLPPYDPSCIDNSRKSFLVSHDMFFYVSENIYDTTPFAKLQSEQEDISATKTKKATKRSPKENKVANQPSSQASPVGGDTERAPSFPSDYNGIAFDSIIPALVQKICRKTQLDAFGNPSQGNRHLTWLKCCSHLRTITDNNPQWLHQLAPQWAFDSPGNDVMQTCIDACEEKMTYGISRTLQNIIDEQAKIIEANDPSSSRNKDKQTISWQENFRSKHKMPDLPPIIRDIIKGCPKGYEDAMLMHLMSMFGAMCFSKLRAEYLDGEIHAPNIQVIIEGPWGQGKGKFESVYFKLFERTIERDKLKLGLEAEWDETAERTSANKDLAEKIHQIVQTAGIGITKSKLVDVLSDNMKVHLYMYESEIKAVTTALRTNYGLTYEHIRKAFENGLVYQNTKSRQSKTGIFPVFFNYTFTGTPVDVEKFIGKELEGGTASRIAWGVIPGSGRDPQKLIIPRGADLERIRDKIDEWQVNYCYDTIEGEDVAADDTLIDLGYVNTQLHEWLLTQWDLGELELNKARQDARLRMGTIAFHCSLVIAAMWGFPTTKDKATRQKVCDLTKYIATLCMERFIHKFMESQNEQTKYNKKMEQKKESKFILDYLKVTFTRDEFVQEMGKLGKSSKPSNINTCICRLKKANLIIETKKKNVFKKTI